jgi:hypothetical protein
MGRDSTTWSSVLSLLQGADPKSKPGCQVSEEVRFPLSQSPRSGGSHRLDKGGFLSTNQSLQDWFLNTFYVFGTEDTRMTI